MVSIFLSSRHTSATAACWIGRQDFQYSPYIELFVMRHVILVEAQHALVRLSLILLAVATRDTGTSR